MLPQPPVGDPVSASRTIGQGIGARCVQHVQQVLVPPVRLYTFQANAGARRFYERQGFRAIAFGDGSGNEERCPDVLYESDGAETPPIGEHT